MTRKAKYNRPRVTVEKQGSGDYLLTVNDSTYCIDRLLVTGVDNIAKTIRRNDNAELVCDRPRDFGGCGRNAMKLEKNVPLSVWLREVYALELTSQN